MGRNIMGQNCNGNSVINHYTDGLLNIDLETQMVELDGKILDLSATEYGLLACLVRNMGRTVTEAQIQREIWGCQYGNLSAMLTIYICNLRKKLEDSQHEHQYIQAMWGHGYCFIPVTEIEIQAGIEESGLIPRPMSAHA